MYFEIKNRTAYFVGHCNGNKAETRKHAEYIRTMYKDLMFSRIKIRPYNPYTGVILNELYVIRLVLNKSIRNTEDKTIIKGY